MTKRTTRSRVLMPRFMDTKNHNAQNLNSRSMLKLLGKRLDITTIYYNEPDSVAVERSKTIRLLRWRFFAWHILVLYLVWRGPIFYPGHQWFDSWGIRLRKITSRKTPIIATLEEIPWMPEEQKKSVEEKIGHTVHCTTYEASKHNHQVLSASDHVIAISPFLAKIGKHFYGNKFSVIPLGIDRRVFYRDETVQKEGAVTVICSGTVYERKRPELFIELAKRMPNTKFVWYGGGVMLEKMRERAKNECHGNLEFAGAVDHHRLADAFRAADLFVLPSLSEGVPKVSQEAAACGLPLVLFGHYEAPSLVDGQNGVVVWSDEELFHTVADLVNDRERLDVMGKRSQEMAKEWDWGRVAPKWLKQIRSII